MVNPPKGCRFAPRCQYASERCVAEEPPLRPAEDDPTHLYACWYPVGSPEYFDAKQRLATTPVTVGAAGGH
jgi:peptide/nickel transport system ATP-binding protein